jgi:hypothetical protein
MEPTLLTHLTTKTAAAATTATAQPAAPESPQIALSQQSQQSKVSFAESATLIGSQSSAQTFPSLLEGESGDSANLPPAEGEEPNVLPLWDRLPAIQDVISGLKSSPPVRSILDTPGMQLADCIPTTLLSECCRRLHSDRNNGQFVCRLDEKLCT